MAKITEGSLSKRLEDLIKYSARTAKPKLYAPILRRLERFSLKFPSLFNEALGMLIETGLLSSSEQGNYSGRSSLFPDFPVCFKLDDKRLYFTLIGTCKDYLQSYRRVNVFQHGDYTFPENPSPEDWQVMRTKHLYNDSSLASLFKDFSDFPYRLVEPGFLTSEKAGHFNVVYTARNKVLPLDFSRNPFGLYFTLRKYAEDFAKNLPFETRIVYNE